MLFRVELKLLYFRLGANIAGKYGFFIHVIVQYMYAETSAKRY